MTTKPKMLWGKPPYLTTAIKVLQGTPSELRREADSRRLQGWTQLEIKDR